MSAAGPLLCIAGPTGSGKSAAALALAEALAPVVAVEIVSVDSAQVYRGLDIGTAKPSAAERAAVPHHLIDVADPFERYSAARFAADASRAIEAIVARGALPVLVGGTMLYFKALIDGLDAMPAADPALRAELDARAARDGWPALHAELARVDPRAAARIAPADAQRIQRALEVWQLSGRPISAWHRAPAATVAPPLIALEPANRGWLHARIDARFAAMLQAGLLDEVRALRARGDLDPALPALRAVGYRQSWAALDAAEATRAAGGPGAPLDLAALHAQSVAATRRLAKRQLTWLRGLPERRVVAADAADAPARLVRLARTLLGR